MKYNQWLVPNKIIYQTLAGHFDPERAMEAMTEARQLVDESDEVLVHIISDMRHNTHMPQNANEARKIMDVLLSHPRIGWVVIYGLDNRLITFLATLISQIFKVRFRSLKTQEEVIEFLESTVIDCPSLAPLLDNLKIDIKEAS